ncbi:MAG: glucose-6-phosphate isomerase [Oscillospiraceae bacterium]|nr:glucose-6-phosphate isomerase [Oscillospiraceae bacterium]
MIKVNIEGTLNFIDESELRGTGTARDFNMSADTGWVNLPKSTENLAEIKEVAGKIRGESEALVVIGIGGSYLGARAAIEFIKNTPDSTDIYFAGNNVSGEYLKWIIDRIGSRDFSVNVVSKSGSTIETAIALRFFKELLLTRYGQAGLKRRLYITTDAGSPLYEMAAREGYRCLEMPPGVGGRYSVLTAVGLLPCAVAGIDIDEMMLGAREEMETGRDNAALYASSRQALYREGKKIEILASFEPVFKSMGEWWKQLFGESEGKAGRGIFPAYADYTADLHSLGQYIQEGERTLIETFVTFDRPRVELDIPGGPIHDDKIGALAGLDLGEINRAASEAVKKAHIDGGVPVIELHAPGLTAASFGALVYFFQRSCAISATISGVYPFDQPGVEAYKKNLYAILGL